MLPALTSTGGGAPAAPAAAALAFVGAAAAAAGVLRHRRRAAATTAATPAAPSPPTPPPPPPPPPPPTAAEVARLTRLVAAERAGRAAAERALRDAVNGRLYDASSPAPGYPVFPVGTVRGPFRQRRGAGRQGLLVPDARAAVVLAPSVPPETLEGLDGYSHAYLLWVFHENTIAVPPAPRGGGGSGGGRRQAAAAVSGADGAAAPAAAAAASPGDPPPPQRPPPSGGNPWTTLGRSFAARVAAPGLYGAKTGVFATRSPHRPNALGLSLVRLVRVDPGARTVTVSGCDLIEGTPVVDIKPAAPFDCPVCVGRVLRAAGGWEDEGGGGGGAGWEDESHHHSSHDHHHHSAAAAAAAPSPPSPPPPPSLLLPPPPATYTHVPLAATPDMWALRLPPWVERGLSTGDRRLPVAFAPGALEALRALALGGALTFYRGGDAAEADAAVRAVVQTLSLDIRAVHRGRGGAVVAAAARGGGGGDDEGEGGGDGDGADAAAGGALTATAAAASAAAPGGGGGYQYQSYELYYDALYVVFTVRPADDAPAPAAASPSTSTDDDVRTPLWCCVESVAHAPLPAAKQPSVVGRAKSRPLGSTYRARYPGERR
jgi:tRNA (Thr-GGU) A37 N-methylase